MRVVLFLVVMFAALPARSQILNVEKSRLSRDTINYWVGEMNFNLLLHNRSATAGNPVRYTGLGSGADVAYVSGRHRYMLINQLNYSSFTGNPFISTGYSHFRTNLWWKKSISYELFTQYQYDLGRGLKRRFLSGAGLRFTFVDEEKIRVAAGVGAMYEYERWVVPGSEDSETGIEFVYSNFGKSTNYISARWQVNEYVNLNSIVYFQTGYDRWVRGFRNRFSTDTNLNVKLTQRMTFFASFSGAYDSRPVVPIYNFIYSLNNGIKVGF